MGWSKPKIPTSKDVQRWSLQVCLFVLLAGALVALTYGILHSPADGLPAPASGHWLSLTGRMMAGVMTVLTGYLLQQESQVYRVWRWSSRRHSAFLVRQQRTHQHRYSTYHVPLISDTQLLPRLAGTSYEDNNNDPSLTLLAEEPLIPGIVRLEQLCQLLINQIKVSPIQHYPSGRMTVLIETSAPDKEHERITLIRSWKKDELPQVLNIRMSPIPLPLSDENNHLFDIDNPVLALMLHYRQPEENLPGFANASLLLPPESLKVSVRRDTVWVLRPMPLNINAISRELTELRDMTQQPVNTRYLAWRSGLTQASQQAPGRVVNDLPLSLHNGIATGGIIDADRVIAAYGPPAGWLMVATAAEMVRYEPGNHWLLQVRNRRVSAVVTGNDYSVINQEYLNTTPSPYPVGPLILAVMFNILVLWFTGWYSQEWLFSWAGVAMTLLLMIVTLLSIAFGLRSAVVHPQHPRFIQAIVCAQKEQFVMKRVMRLLGVGLLLPVVLLLTLFVLAQTTPLILAQDEHVVWLRLLIIAIVICLLSMCILSLFSFRQNEVSTISLYAQSTDIKEINTEQLNYASLLTIYLHDRYGPFRRCKVRLLLVTGEPEQVEATASGLTRQHWLEDDHTVLIYGGRSTAESDVALLTASKKLRRSRPLDGIIWVLIEEQSRQTAQLDKGWRGLIDGGKRLGLWVPPYLWQVCDDSDYQTGRLLQSVGCLLPECCTPEQLAVILEAQIPPLMEQGMSQLLTDNRHDSPLYLAHILAERGIAHWQTALKPLLADGAFSSLCLRGLMFSPSPAVVPEAAPHAWLPSPV